MASRIILIASCMILSRGGAIDRGLVPLFSIFGISTLLAGENENSSDFSNSLNLMNSSKLIPSKVVGTIPGLILPGLLLILL